MQSPMGKAWQQERVAACHSEPTVKQKMSHKWGSSIKPQVTHPLQLGRHPLQLGRHLLQQRLHSCPKLQHWVGTRCIDL